MDALIAYALDLSPEDEVIVPSHTYSVMDCTFESKCRLVVAPVDEKNLLLDPSAIESLITPKTSAFFLFTSMETVVA